MSVDVSFHDYHRTIVAYHGTTAEVAEELVSGRPFQMSDNDDDWMGTGVYFWEYAPRQAWWWAENFKHYEHPAVVGAVIRLGNCFALLDPQKVTTLSAFYGIMSASGEPLPTNGRQFKRLDCAVFNYLYDREPAIETARGVYVPTQSRNRIFPASWIYEQAHIQVCVREPQNILAAWHVRRDGRYGRD